MGWRSPVLLADMPAAARPGRIAILIPAWDEAQVIAAMLRHAIGTIDGGDWHIYVGVYPNDPATAAAIASVASARITTVTGHRAGPTTKAQCLNTIWARLRDDEEGGGFRYKAVVLHDAEDVVHASEVRVYDRMIEGFDLVQIPVVPIIDPASRWIAGHYADEFAESHGKTIVVRHALGAAIPSAGVGCAFARDILDAVAQGRSGPFDDDSLTEDYELGLRIAEHGGRGAFVRLAEAHGGRLVAVRAHFPARLNDAVRQKTRWVAGIALAGWDRLGWHGGLVETWMRIHDRRAIVSAAVLFAGYAACALTMLVGALVRLRDHGGSPPTGAWVDMEITVCSLLLLWRLMLRALLTARTYGWREGARAVPRALVANVVAMMAAWRAIALYRRMRRRGTLHWDKTAHHFPARPEAV